MPPSQARTGSAVELAVPRPRRKPGAFWSRALLAAAVIIAANGVFGERGLTETMRARQAYASAAADLSRTRAENAALRERVRELREDPSAIEAVARGELGLVRPGEILVTVHTLPR